MQKDFVAASPICSARKSLRLKARRRCANSLSPRSQSTGMNGQIDAPPAQRQRLAASPPPPQARPPEPQPAFCGSPTACWKIGSTYQPAVLDYAPAPQQQRQAASPPPPQAKPPEPQSAYCGHLWRVGETAAFIVR